MTDELIKRANEIAEREQEKLLKATPGSAHLHERAVKSMPDGVASNFQANDPYPVYLDSGKGSHVYDVDQNDVVYPLRSDLESRLGAHPSSADETDQLDSG